MKPILVAFATTEGHTRKVAEFVAERLRSHGHTVQLLDAATPAAAQVQPVFAGALLLGSVHQGRHQAALMHFVLTNGGWLRGLPTAFISVSLAAADADGEPEARRVMQAFIDETGLAPGMTLPLAGALRYTEYDFFKRWIMRAIARTHGRSTDTTHDTEYTDWDALGRFVDEYASHAQLVRRKAA